MARRRRRYHGITSISLGNLPVGLNDHVAVQDVLLGIVAGLGASAVLKGLLNKFLPVQYAQLKNAAGPAVPLLASAGAGAALYMLQKGSDRAKGHAVGAVAAGLAVTVMGYLPKVASMIPGVPFDFSDVVSVNLGGLGGYGGLLVADSSDQFNGLLVADKSDDLNQLAAYSMGDSDDDGLESLAAI